MGAFKARYGDYDIGGGMAAMLTSALLESGQFLVTERANLSQILNEQELKGQQVTTGGTGPELGKLIGAQFLIYGAVTEFGTDDKGGGLSVGFMGLGGSQLGGSVGPQFSKGKVAMDIRVVDTTTGEIIENYRVEEKARSTALNAGINVKNVSIGSNQFMKTPLGEATRRAINAAVQRFTAGAAKIAWIGRIADVEGSDVYINAGKKDGVQQGDKFRVFRTTQAITDPDTGRVLKRKEQAIGTLEVIKVEDALAAGVFVAETRATEPTRGDFVRHITR
jgi:curli biogenesis system outer membrane secretion channel CsgG